jgi:hypothetical protein
MPTRKSSEEMKPHGDDQQEKTRAETEESKAAEPHKDKMKEKIDTRSRIRNQRR